MVILLKHDHYPVIVNSLLSSKHYQLGAELAIGRVDDTKNTTFHYYTYIYKDIGLSQVVTYDAEKSENTSICLERTVV
jgi:hypothetical protein